MRLKQSKALFEKGKGYVVARLRQLRAKYDALSRKQKDLVRIGSLIGILILPVLWNMTLPKLSEVDAMYARGDAAGLCLYIERYGQCDSWTIVMRGAAKAALDLGGQDTLVRLNEMIGEAELAAPVRVAIVEQFGEHQFLPQGLFAYIASDKLPPEVSQALVAAANKADGNVFEEQVERELKSARELAVREWNAALRQAEHARIYDRNGLMSSKINSVQYAIHAYRLRGLVFPADLSQIKAILGQMAALNCPESLREGEYIAYINRLVDEYQRVDAQLRGGSKTASSLQREDRRRMDQLRQKLRRDLVESIRRFGAVERGIPSQNANSHPPIFPRVAVLHQSGERGYFIFSIS